MQKSKYLPSIDSLRAIAVIAVIIYHIDTNYLTGGFLGVDLFFVLSGYLISSLIIKEYRKTGTINLYNFYLRRARRLLPAVYFMITISLIFMVLFNGVLLKKSNLDAVFGYIYSSNWWYIFHKLDYFDTFGAQSPFKHLWSLAIEEQFYMFFPLIFLFFARDKKNGNNIAKNFKYIILALIGVSLLAHILLFDINNVSRVYFGTDTRAFSLLVGVMGAIFYPMENLFQKPKKNDALIYNVASLTSIMLLIIVMIFANEYQAWLYYGGFLVIAVLCLVVIISSGKQHTLMSKLLSFKPLVYIGKISYSLYLWHFPILILTTPTSQIGNPNIFYSVLRVVLIFVVATASYAFVEMPIRKLGFINYVNIIFKKIVKLPKKMKNIALGVTVISSIFFVMGIFGKGLPFLSTAFVKEIDTSKNEQKFVSNDGAKPVQNDNKVENKGEYTSLLVVGDSLTVDVGKPITERFPNAVVDGEISRQLYMVVDLVDKYKDYNNNSTAVVFQLGTNGPFKETQLDELIKKFDKADIYFVNVKVPRAWEKTVNELLTKASGKYQNVKIIDWYKEATAHPEYFEPDRVHLIPSGSQALSDLIASNFKRKVSFEKSAEQLKKEKEQGEVARSEEKSNSSKNSNTSNNSTEQSS